MSAIPTFDPFKATTGVLGNFFNGVSLLLPWCEVFRDIRRLKSSDDYSVLPYTLQLLSGALWILFSTHDPGNSFFLVTISAFSLCINSFYTATHIYYGGVISRWRTLFALLTDWVIVAATLLIDDLAIGGSWYHHFLLTGIAATLAGIGCNIPTLLTMKKVIKEQNSIHLSLWSTVCSLLGYKSWILYGIHVKNWMILLPNIIGLAIGIAQIVLLCIYPQIPASELSVYASATSSPTPVMLTPALSSPPATPTMPTSTLSPSSGTPTTFSTTIEILPPPQPAPPRRCWWWAVGVVGVVAVVGGYVFLF